MSTDQRHAKDFLARLRAEKEPDELRRRLAPNLGPSRPKVPSGAEITPEALNQRWEVAGGPPEVRQALMDPQTQFLMAAYQRNIENFIGTVKVPVGLAGPLRVNGLFAHGDYYIPLATTEAALVASHNRGAQLITEAGGCSAVLVDEGISRAPGFAFGNLLQAGEFVVWMLAHMDEVREVGQSTTRFGKMVDMRITIEGNHVYLNFEFITGDASGQNMVTIATDAICKFVAEHCPIKPEYYFVEANLSGDKKASFQSFLSVRGRRVTAEICIPQDLIQRRLHTTPEHMVNYWRMSAIGGVLSGTMGVQGHYANGLAALYIACGQDAACVSESAVGVTRMEVRPDGALYVAVTLPNLMVGTVGGGTNLPSQMACLELMGLRGKGHAQALAEVCAGLALAGELSIIGALTAGHFTQAHQKLARGPQSEVGGAEDGGKIHG